MTGYPPPSSSNNKKRELNKTKFQTEIEDAYQAYPNKKGKSVGIKKLTSQIKNETEMQNLKTAIKNYAAECKDKDPQYIKHFSTFAGCWQDYLDAAPKQNRTSDWVPMILVDGRMVPMTEG